jgi:AraC family transcriptional activator of pobA
MSDPHSDDSSGGISDFGLYGEARAKDRAEFIHIEDIRSRSRLYDWRITAHIHRGMFQLVYLRGGAAEVWVDQTTHAIHPPCAVCVPSGTVHGFSFKPESAGWVLTVAEQLLLDDRYRRSRELFEPLFREPLLLSFADNPQGATTMATTLGQLHAEFQWPQTGRGLMLEWMLRMVLMTLCRQLDTEAPTAEGVGRQRALFTRFRQLVEDHYREQWPVAQYAEALAMSQARLNRLCKAQSGQGAGELVQERMALEAQRHLIYTSASVSMIAYELGFKDPAYFSRFFKRRCGQTPGDFRADKLAKSGAGSQPSGVVRKN